MISAVIPAFNEESTLEEAVLTTAAVLARLSPSGWEILVVDAGSQDRTYQVAQQLAYDNHIKLIRHDSNRGKGAAVRSGVMNSRGDAVLIMDADLSTRPETLESFIPALTEGADLITGDRRNPASHIDRPQPILRRVMGRVYVTLARTVTGSSLRDFNCGFKLIRGDTARSLLAQCRSDRWVWDVEAIALALRQGLEVKAIPVTWRQGDRTAVAPFNAALVSIIELAKLWFRLRRKVISGF